MDAKREYDRFFQKFMIDELRLAYFGNWVVSVRPMQVTLGALVVSLNRPCLGFSGLEFSEARDLRDVYASIESVLREFVSFQKMNYMALMMVDAHLHFHAIPRYDRCRLFGGVEYPDHGWPALPEFGKGMSDVAAVSAVRDALREAFISGGVRN